MIFRTLGRISFAAALSLAPLPAIAQSEPELRLDELDRTLRQMLDRLKPAVRDMFRLMQEFEDIDDPRHYMMPEVLPNGDIIIRRRPDAPPLGPRYEDQRHRDPVEGETKT